MTVTERISVDFNTMNADPKSLGSPEAERRVAINPRSVRPSFQPSMLVVIYDDELEVEATLELDEAFGEWWARPDWSTRLDLGYPHYLRFATREPAEQGATVLRSEGYTVDIIHAADDAPWLALVRRPTDPLDQADPGVRKRLEHLAASLGGEYHD